MIEFEKKLIWESTDSYKLIKTLQDWKKLRRAKFERNEFLLYF